MYKMIVPEGRNLKKTENQRFCENLAGLQSAYVKGAIVEGIALQCEKGYGIQVQLGAFTGFIPWEEGAQGLAEGLVREIAIMSRVGRPVSVIITEIREENGVVTPILSRNLAQKVAREHILSLPLGTVVPATVTRLETFGAFVDIGCGIASLLSIDRISISRIHHPTQRFFTGQEIYVAILERDLELMRVSVTHRELLGTWEENAKQFTVGMTVIGIVRSVKEYGIFIEIAPNFTGLAEFASGYTEGQQVSVFIKAVSREQMKCKLLIIGTLPKMTPQPLCYTLPENGRIQSWYYAPVGSKKEGVEIHFEEDKK